jgi:hypothetical protein
MLLRVEKKSGWNELRGSNDKALLDNVAALPSCRSLKLEIPAWMRSVAVFVLANVGIRIFHLVEVSQSVIDFTMLALVGADYKYASESA